jgi:hypothetical protein
MAKAKKAKATPKKGATAKKGAAKKAPANNALGCCNIIYDDARPSEQVAGVTKDACVRLGRARGGTGQWNPGACA